VWALAVVPVAWRSTWIANAVDTLGPFTVLERSIAQPELNLLIGDVHSRVSGIFLVGQGVGLNAVFGEMPLMQVVQLCNLLWIGIGGTIVAIFGARVFGIGTAPVLAAALLFAPYTVASTLFLAPMSLGIFLAPLLLLLLHRALAQRSSAALVGMGGLAGLQIMNPTLTLLVGLMFGIALIATRLRPAVPLPASLAALIAFVAAALPGGPRAFQVGELASSYARGQSSWAMVEALYFGQVDPDRVKFAEDVEPSAKLVAPLGSMLAPFAVPRTAMRIWGDTLFEPFSGILVAVGIAVCLRSRSLPSLCMLALLGAASLPSFASSYDRASLTRSAGLVAPVILLAGVGLAQVRQALIGRLPERWFTILATGLVMVSGWVLTQHVNPMILGRSATGIALDALIDSAPEPALILVPAWWDAQGSQIFAGALSSQGVKTIRYQGPATLLEDDVRQARILFWSPALEEQRPAGKEICATWPGTRIFTIHDEAGLSFAFAANPADDNWTPQLPPGRWRGSSCGTPLPTARRQARIAMAKARHHLEGGRPQPALDHLRVAAMQSIVEVEVFDLLARTLLRYGMSAGDLQEATFWAERAVQISNACPSRPVSTLVRAYRRAGRVQEAHKARARAKRMRAAFCRGLRIGHPWRTP